MDKRNVFISFVSEDKNLKEEIANIVKVKSSHFDVSEDEDRSHQSHKTIWEYLKKRIDNSTITIAVLSCNSREKYETPIGGLFDIYGNMKKWPYAEISASLRDWKNNRIAGLILLIKDECYDYYMIKNSYGRSVPSTLMPEIFRQNIENGYIIVDKMSEFRSYPNWFIKKAWERAEEQRKFKKYDIKYNQHLE